MIKYFQTLFFLLASGSVFAQQSGPVMIKDLMDQNNSSTPTILHINNDLMYITARNNKQVLELMVIDIKDSTLTPLGVDYTNDRINPSSMRFFEFKGKTYFLSSSSFSRCGLWVTDGTANGTSKRMELEMNSVDYHAVTSDFIFVSARTDSTGRELFVINSSTDSAYLVKDIYRGKTDANPQDMVADSNRIFFSASDSAHGKEVWVSDGTESGTHLVSDVYTGTGAGNPSVLFVYKHDIYFKARNPSTGYYHIWRSVDNDTSVVSFLDKDSSLISQINDPVICNDILYFAGNRVTYGNEIYRTDGTRAGTYVVKDLDPGYNTSAPADLVCLTNGKILFTQEIDKGRELYVTDGTSSGTYLTRDLFPIQTDAFISNMTGSDSTLFFSAHEKDKYQDLELYVYRDGKNYRIKDIYEGLTSSSPSNFYPYKGGVFLTADDGKIGREIWYSDGTTSGTKVFFDVSARTPDNVIKDIAAIPGGVIFNASTPSIADEAWTFNANSGEIKNLIDYKTTTPGQPRNFMSTQGGVYYSILPGSFDMEINYYDFSTGKIEEILDNGYKNVVGNFKHTNNKFFYTLHVSLLDNIWVYDENTKSTSVVTSSIQPNGFGATASKLTVVGDRVFFTADNYTEGVELYVTDGTKSGTKLVKDIYPDYYDSRPLDLCSYRDSLLLFTATTSSSRELYITDGTSANTRIVKSSANSGPMGSREMTEAFGRIFFTAQTSSNGSELWVTNGTDTGTHIFKDLVSGTTSSNPANYTLHSGLNLLFFTTQDSLKRYSLWRTDGTDTGTYMVQTFEDTSFTGNYTPEFTSSSDKLYFSARTDAYGVELWESDGTASGTKLVKDIMPGNAGSFPQSLVVSEGYLYFSAEDELHGRELWYMLAVCLEANIKLPLHVCQGDSIIPEVSLTRQDQGSTVSYNWYLNGQPVSTAAMYTTTADSLTPYEFSLKVSDSNGCSSQKTATTEVVSYPKADFTIDNDTQCFANNRFRFTNTTQGDGTQSYLWLRGDGGQTTTSNPQFVYNKAGKYEVQLIATHKDLCSDTAKAICYAVAAPQTSSITGNSISNNDTEPYSAITGSQNPNTFDWTVTNGTILSGQGTKTITVEWTSRPTTSSITLTETSPEGCVGNTVKKTVTVTKNTSVEDVSTLNINIHPNPSSGILLIEHNGQLDNGRIVVTDYTGKTVYTSELSGITTELRLDVPDGIYLVHLNDELHQYVQRIVIQR